MNPSSPTPSPARGWRIGRRTLLAAAALATLVAVLYTVENWRGRRAWENCRRELEARGEVLDWSAYIPAPVPNEQNFFKAPYMKDWFVKDSLLDLLPSARPAAQRTTDPFTLPPEPGTNLAALEVRVVTTNSALEPQAAGEVLSFDTPSARERAGQLLRDALGPCAFGARMETFVVRSPDQYKPVRLLLLAGAVPSVKDLASFFPRNPFTNSGLSYSEASYLEAVSTGSSTFRVGLKKPVYGAAEFLAWTDPLTAKFDLVREALKRPYARIDCDYQQPYAIGIPNFVRLREAVQILSERAQCDLLLSRPEEAWQELKLIHELCEILKAKPSGKPITLVGAMIHVAIMGLYTSVVEDGLRLHAWREPQLLAIEQQLQETDLLSQVAEALREERAATCRTIEITKRRELVRLFSFGSPQNSWHDWLGDATATLTLSALPRGWFYQNMAVGAKVEQELLGSVDSTNRLVRPEQAESYYRGLEARLKHRSPYNFLVAISIPNFLRAMQTAARNQTLVDQARLAGALERYRLAQGQYPDTLDALTPRILEKLPHDIIGGQPFKYRQLDGGGYLVYSIGWNGKDDGGTLGKSLEDGDWVWQIR